MRRCYLFPRPLCSRAGGDPVLPPVPFCLAVYPLSEERNPEWQVPGILCPSEAPDHSAPCYTNSKAHWRGCSTRYKVVFTLTLT